MYNQFKVCMDRANNQKKKNSVSNRGRGPTKQNYSDKSELNN